MRTLNHIVMRASIDACFRAAADVERWPDMLAHYRWVRFRRRDGFGTGRVEMAARRPFGPLDYPVWWVSEMYLDESAPAVVYRHVEGITTGMDVAWSFRAIEQERTGVSIVHEWKDGPAWPLPPSLRRRIAEHVVGPAFVHNIAHRTLSGIRMHVETHPSDTRPLTR